MVSWGKTLALMLAALFLTSLVAISSAVPAHATPSWNVQTVDVNAAGIGNGYSPIVIDSNDKPHMTYTDASFSVTYASWKDSNWSIQTLGEGEALSLALDANDNPHVLYDVPIGPLVYASWTGLQWSRQIVDGNGAGYGVVALDSSDNPHVAYLNSEGVNYASLNGSKWNIQTIDNSSEVYGLSLAVDKNNTPFILYSPSSYADFSQPVGIRALNTKLATFQNLSWNIQTVPLPPPTGDYGNIVVDSKGNPHFVCTKHYHISAENMTILSTIFYVSWNGTAWTTQTVISDISLLESTPLRRIGSLALDSNDYPHISYVVGPYPEDQSMHYASWTGTEWNIQTVDINFTAREPSYLAVDSNCNPHISFRRGGLNDHIATIVYTTANVTDLVQESSPSFPSLAVTVTTASIGVAVTVAVVYVWKKRNNSTPSRVQTTVSRLLSVW